MNKIGTCLVGFGLFAGGCAEILDFVQSSRTTVRLVNNGAYAVQVELFISDQQEIPEVLLIADDDNREEFTVGAGDVVTFSRDCDDLQAIIIHDADLQVIGQAGADTRTEVLRDGDDFGCGDTINFIFDHSELIVDFDVDVSVQQ
jgi:hypothetical protein